MHNSSFSAFWDSPNNHSFTSSWSQKGHGLYQYQRWKVTICTSWLWQIQNGKHLDLSWVCHKRKTSSHVLCYSKEWSSHSQHIFLTHALHVHYMHYMCTTCALHVHTTCALHVHTTCALHVHYMCTDKALLRRQCITFNSRHSPIHHHFITLR